MDSVTLTVLTCPSISEKGKKKCLKILRVSHWGVTIDGWFSHTRKWNKRTNLEIINVPPKNV